MTFYIKFTDVGTDALGRKMIIPRKSCSKNLSPRLRKNISEEIQMSLLKKPGLISK